MKKIQRERLQREEKILAEETERLMDSAMEDDRRKFQEVETEKADEMVWLMKCPPRVAKAWRELSASSSSSSSEFVPVAKYSDSVDLLLPDLSPEFNMEMVSAEIWNISKVYSVNKARDFVGPVSIFSEANQGQVAVEGTVTHKLDIRPNRDIEEYGKLFRERNMKRVAETRQIQVLDNCCGVHLMRKPEMVTKKLKRCVRKTRSDSSEVEAKMFELFERQPKWTLKQLVQETNQPEVCSLLQTLYPATAEESSITCYELKPRYKKTGYEGTAGAQ